YSYDQNGNLRTDSRKGLNFEYNHLNLSKKVTKGSTGESISYLYDASGRKLRKETAGGNRDYIGGIEYGNNGNIEFVQTEEGRAVNTGGTYSYEYMLKDHLGNTRAVVKQDGSILQTPDYYAFGMELNRNRLTPSPDNRYKYNGKELQTELGLGQYDYGARFYDAVVGRFTTMDPLTNKYASFTPYNYTFNNPVRFIDPDGRDTALYNAIGGQLITRKPGGEKTAIYTVDGNSDSFDSDNPWANAEALTYQVGRKSGGLSGRSFRSNHPLRNIGTRVGSQVFLEDLLDLTSEFTSIVRSGIPEFSALRGLSTRGGFLSDRAEAFQDLVTDGAKYDLKSLTTSDGTPSYAASVIGEWSILNGTLRRYDDYGNISYGAFGVAAGFSQSFLFQGSNLNQLWKDITGKTNGSGDERRDIDMMRTGIVNYQFYLKK
ncbi:polymorphic toxin type 44 domain-containing protein, partial [Pararcticibacter amylolyticus]